MRGAWTWLARAGLAGWLLSASALAAPPEAPESAALRGVILQQVSALTAGDAAAAFGVVSDSLRQQLGSADRFLDIVRTGYPEVVGPRRVHFGATLTSPHGVAQEVTFEAADGRRISGLYLLVQTPAGWRTAGYVRTTDGPGVPLT